MGCIAIFLAQAFFEFQYLVIEVLIIAEADKLDKHTAAEGIGIPYSHPAAVSMLFSGFKKGFDRLPFAVFPQAFKRISFLVGYKDKVTVVLVCVRDGFVIGDHCYFAAPFFDGKVFFYLCLR